MRCSDPIISFSFDDAPQSAFSAGGDILRLNGISGTYYVSLGLLDNESPSGRLASFKDIDRSIEQGHELGCHTYEHLNPRKTAHKTFLDSVRMNKNALSEAFPGAVFPTFAYPYDDPPPSLKKAVGSLFMCCRGGRQQLNKKNIDMNLVKSFFLDSRTGVSMEDVSKVVSNNVHYKGWLVLSTHDIAENPSPYGCNVDIFAKVVDLCIKSGARILNVGKACERILSESARQ